MNRWIFKTALQRVISLLPSNHRWNGLFQRYITKGLDLTPARFDSKLACCRIHLENALSWSSGATVPQKVLELGTGWFPIVPLGLYLCGTSDLRTYDVVPLIDRFTLKQAIDRFCEYAEDDRLRATLPWVRSERIEALRAARARLKQQPVRSLLQGLGIHTIIGDACQTGMESGSIDFVFSTVSLEHLRRAELVPLFSEFKRICRGGAIMSHYIGLSDQFASFDRSISPFNFLRYTERRWRWFDNPIIPQNRLRISDYRDVHQETGFEILRETSTSGSAGDLHRIVLAPEFSKYSEDDLLVLNSWLVSTPAAAKGKQPMGREVQGERSGVEGVA